MSAEELKFISENGAVVDMDHKKPGESGGGVTKRQHQQLLSNRMMLGVFFGQYFINTITTGSSSPGLIYLRRKSVMSICVVWSPDRRKNGVVWWAACWEVSSRLSDQTRRLSLTLYWCYRLCWEMLLASTTIYVTTPTTPRWWPR